MVKEEHLEILNQGIDVWNSWRKDNPNIKPQLSWKNLEGAVLVGADLHKAELRGTRLMGAALSGVDLSRTDLYDANLSKADLLGADLASADLSWADLSGADLTGARLWWANFWGANLSGAKLREADLGGANFSGAKLREADLRRAIFMKANLSGADLTRADLSNSRFCWTAVINVDLREIKGLQSITHEGPSFIGIDTIYRSQGKIPERFLRGAGVPDIFIEQVPDLMGDAQQFNSCFISYSTRDQEFAERLHSDLQAAGIRCWFAPEDIRGGRKLHEQIPQAIRLFDKLLLVLSENSMRSEWVKTEIYHARQDEIRAGKRKLFPIGLVEFEEIRQWEAFDADIGKDMARKIREYFIPDFSDWKDHDSYKKAFDRLLRDLKAGG